MKSQVLGDTVPLSQSSRNEDQLRVKSRRGGNYELPNCGHCGRPPQATAPPPAPVGCAVRGSLSFPSIYPQPQLGTPPCCGCHRLWPLNPVPCGDTWGWDSRGGADVSWQDQPSTAWDQPGGGGAGLTAPQSSLEPRADCTLPAPQEPPVLLMPATWGPGDVCYSWMLPPSQATTGPLGLSVGTDSKRGPAQVTPRGGGKRGSRGQGGCPRVNPQPQRSVCRTRESGSRLGLGAEEGLSARGGACLGGVWTGRRWPHLELGGRCPVGANARVSHQRVSRARG